MRILWVKLRRLMTYVITRNTKLSYRYRDDFGIISIVAFSYWKDKGRWPDPECNEVGTIIAVEFSNHVIYNSQFPHPASPTIMHLFL